MTTSDENDRGPTPVPVWMRLVALWLVGTVVVAYGATATLGVALLGPHLAGAMFELVLVIGVVGMTVHLVRRKQRSNR